MKNCNTLILIISIVLLTSCSDITDPPDQGAVQNDPQTYQTLPIEDSIKGLWERTDGAEGDIYYAEITDEMIIHYTFLEHPWGLEGACYETQYERLKRISENEYRREDYPRHTKFILSEKNLTIAQIDVFDDDLDCIFGEVEEATFKSVENINSQDFALCHVIREELGIEDSTRVVHDFDPELEILDWEPVIYPTCD